MPKIPFWCSFCGSNSDSLSVSEDVTKTLQADKMLLAMTGASNIFRSGSSHLTRSGQFE
jgi:hypothetical protein